MTYIDVIWHTTDPADPIRLVSELDECGFETRKIECFHNGAVDFADVATSTNGCDLDEVAVPALAQINVNREFLGVQVT